MISKKNYTSHSISSSSEPLSHLLLSLPDRKPDSIVSTAESPKLWKQEFCSLCIRNKSNSYKSGIIFFLSITKSKKNAAHSRSWRDILAWAQRNVKKTCNEIYDLDMLLSYLYSCKPHIFQNLSIGKVGSIT